MLPQQMKARRIGEHYLYYLRIHLNLDELDKDISIFYNLITGTLPEYPRFERVYFQQIYHQLQCRQGQKVCHPKLRILRHDPEAQTSLIILSLNIGLG